MAEGGAGLVIREFPQMTKLLLTPLLFTMACVFAGTYGAIHNQISYTVAPEYFTQFKFHQFRIAADLPDRVGAASVGWSAAWWMGIVIGIVLIPLGLAVRGNSNCFVTTIRAFGVAALTTLAVGLAALAVACLSLDAASVGEITRYGNDIVDDVAFARAGAMHNFSYLGGFIGIVTAGIFIRRRRSAALTLDAAPTPDVE